MTARKEIQRFSAMNSFFALLLRALRLPPLKANEPRIGKANGAPVLGNVLAAAVFAPGVFWMLTEAELFELTLMLI